MEFIYVAESVDMPIDYAYIGRRPNSTFVSFSSLDVLYEKAR